MSALIFIIKWRELHPPPEVCRHPGFII